MYLTLGICTTLKNLKFSRINDIDFDSQVSDFKILVANNINYLKEQIDLVFCGRILQDSTTLKENGLQNGFVVHVLQKKLEEDTSRISVIPESEAHEYTNTFKVLASWNTNRRSLQKLNKGEILENVLLTTPGLRQDSIAVIILKHPELLTKLNDPNVVKRIISEHPALAHAAQNLVATFQNDTLNSPSTSTSFASASNFSNHILPGSDDDDMESLAGNESQNYDREQQVNQITASQVAAALANTAASISANRNATNITSEMMSAAVQNAIASTSTQTNLSPQLAENDAVTMAKLIELRKLGFLNDATNIQALQLSNGDLEAAVNLILTTLSEDNN